jgi:hypothetical protein
VTKAIVIPVREMTFFGKIRKIYPKWMFKDKKNSKREDF